MYLGSLPALLFTVAGDCWEHPAHTTNRFPADAALYSISHREQQRRQTVATAPTRRLSPVRQR